MMSILRSKLPEGAQISKRKSAIAQIPKMGSAARGLSCVGVRTCPRGAKLPIDLIGLVFAPLRIQTIAQSGKRAAIARISVEIGPKNFLGFRGLIVRKKNATEHRPNG